MNWNIISTENDIEELLKSFNYFHDSCLVSLRYISGACVDKADLSMNPINNKRSLFVTFQSQSRNCYSIELLFKKIVKLNLEPDNENYDCSIWEATIKRIGKYICWADTDNFDINNPIGTWIICENILWKKKWKIFRSIIL